MSDELNPTLWRTVRVLANTRRLKVFRTLCEASPLSVSSVAAGCRLSMSEASQILRSLQARGLLRSRRIGAHVLYEPDANPGIAYAAPLSNALRHALRGKTGNHRKIMADLTAYANPRRIAIVRAVADGHRNRETLRAACRFSRQSLWRHLSKLSRRNVLSERDDRTLVLMPPATALAAALLSIALAKTSRRAIQPPHSM